MVSSPKVRVLLADDHVLFNDGLALQLSYENSPVDIVGQVFRGDDVLPAVLRCTPDIILLDINLPQQTGLDCARQVAQDFPAVRVIILTMYTYRKFVEECKRIGVSGYLLKNERAEAIIRTILDVNDGKICFPSEPLLASQGDNFFIRQFNLTPTELKIIGLIRQGLSSQQIAEKLFVSFETIRSHRKNIYRKLNITHLSGLIDFANKYSI